MVSNDREQSKPSSRRGIQVSDIDLYVIQMRPPKLYKALIYCMKHKKLQNNGKIQIIDTPSHTFHHQDEASALPPWQFPSPQ